MARTLTGVGGLIAGALLLPIFRYVFSTRRSAGSEEWIAVGEIERIDANRPTRVEFARKVVDGWVTSNESSSAWILKSHEGTVTAFAPQCTHLGCAYFWDDSRERFNCPCHGSTFTVTGNVEKGPASRPLDRYPARVEAGQLLIQPSAIGTAIGTKEGA